MSEPRNNDDSSQFDPAQVTIRTIVGHLTAPQIVSLVSALVAVVGAALYLGPLLDPDTQSLKAENARLALTLASVEIVGSKTQEMSLETFIAKTEAQTAGLQALYAGRLFAPTIPAPWVAVRDPKARLGQVPNPANDLTLLADAMELPEESIKNLFPSMWAFNEKNPPLMA